MRVLQHATICCKEIQFIEDFRVIYRKTQEMQHGKSVPPSLCQLKPKYIYSPEVIVVWLTPVRSRLKVITRLSFSRVSLILPIPLKPLRARPHVYKMLTEAIFGRVKKIIIVHFQTSFFLFFVLQDLSCVCSILLQTYFLQVFWNCC